MRWPPTADGMAFRCAEIILEDGRPHGQAMDPWQAEDFRALDDPAHQHAYLERPRGHSKTGDAGTECVRALVLGRPGTQIYAAAADEDQARLLLEDVKGKFARNLRLAPLATFKKNEVVMKHGQSRLTVLAADAPSSYGLRPDLIIIDELAEWTRRELWDSLWTATGKRPACRVIVISTAGWSQASIAWEVRQIAEREANWYFSSRGQCASWIAPAWLAQQARTLPAHVYARLHLNRWTEGAGAYLTAEEVNGVFQAIPDGATGHCCGLDLGVSRDRAVLARVGVTADGVACVEHLVTWTPTRTAKVDLADVERETLALAAGGLVVLDPWQGMLMSQRMRSAGVATLEYSFTSDGRKRLFSLLLDLLRTGRLRCRPHDELRRELLGLQVEQTGTGWRVDHHPGRHDDHVIAIALAVAGLAAQPTVTPEQEADDLANLARWQRETGMESAPFGGWEYSVEHDTGNEYHDRDMRWTRNGVPFW